MGDNPMVEEALEPERYELQAEPFYRFELTRRRFFKVFGGGLAIVCLLKDASGQESGEGGVVRATTEQVGGWLHIGEDGTTTVYTGKAEVGQNIRTSLSQAVAEELRLPVSSVKMVMGDTDLTPYDRGTFGSRTTPSMAPQLRRAAAAAREMLLDLASEKWKADRGLLTMVDGKVIHAGTKQVVGFGELTQGMQLMREIRDDEPVIPASRWNTSGKSVPKVNGREIVTGMHRYPSDMRLPGMLYGKMLRPPAFGAKMVSLDAEEALAMPDVTVMHEGDFVGVVAPDEQTAERALGALQVRWETTPQPSRAELFDYLKAQAGDSDGRGTHEVGSVEEGLAAAERTLQQTYTVDYIAHAPLEPRAALAQWEGEKLTVWTGTQRPFGVRSELARAFGISEERVRVMMPDTGSGYGGKHTGEAAIEAARLARGAGKPVKIVWTREEEFTWAYFRPAGVIEVQSGIRGDGTIVAWEFHNYNSGAAAIRPLYEIANQRVVFHRTRSPLRQGSYRGLASPANHFARETHVDELARMVAMDPLEFRKKNLKDVRLLAVLDTVAERFGWGEIKASAGRGYGIAGGFDKGGYVATCAEVEVDRQSGRVRVIRVVEAFECGAIVNPDHLKSQIEGAVVQGLGGALFETVVFENGKILNASFSGYRVPRFSDVPEIEVVLLDRKDLPSAGAGETPNSAIAPALGNAIFDATGIRLRSLPLVPKGLEI